MGRWTFLMGGLLVGAMTLGLFTSGFAEIRYTVKTGDSLYGISKSFGVSIKAIKETNNLGAQSIRPNQVLLIPTQRKSPSKKEDASETLVETDTYVVKKGDTLKSISEKTGIPVEEIQRINNLSSTALRIGQVLVLRKSEEAGSLDESEDGDETSLISVPEKEDENREIASSIEKWNGSGERNLFVRVVKTFLGVPYRLGGSTLKGLDCSALVKKIYEIFNVYLPRTAREQFRFGKKVDKTQLEEGDLVFFKTRRGENAHVGIYIGNNEFVHASYRCREVKIDSLDEPYFSQRFVKGVRVKELENETNL